MATSLFNFDPSPSFSFSDPGVNPMMQPVSILGQQSVSAPQSAPQTAPSSSFNEENLLTGLASVGAMLNEPRKTDGGMLGFGSVNIGSPIPMPAQTPNLSNLDFSRLNFEPSFQYPRPSEMGLSSLFMEGSAPRFITDAASATSDFVSDKAVPSTLNFGRDALEFLTGQDIFSGPTRGVSQPSNISQFLQSSPPTLDPTSDEAILARRAEREAQFAPMGRDATRAMLQERFGAPTISAIQSLPSGQGLGMRTDAQGRMISQGDDRTAFDQASQDRIDRLEARPDFMTAYSDQELRDIAEAGQTESADTGVATRGDARGEMTFEEARKFVPKGERETTKSYNQRIKAYQAQQNSAISELKEQYEQFRVQGQVLNNQRIQAYIAQYQQTEPEKYRETLQVAQEMLRDGLLQDEVQMAMYVIDQMGGKSADIFDPATAFMGGDDGSGQTYTPEQEAKIERFMKANKLGREDALRELRNANRIQ